MDNETFNNGLLKLVNKINTFYFSDSTKNEFYEFIVDGQQVGHILPYIKEILYEYNDLFLFEDKKVILNPVYKTASEKTEVIEEFLKNLNKKNVFQKLTKWRHEHYNVRAKFSEPPLFTIERCAATLFGIRQYGCHVNGYITLNDEYFIWIARRSKTKQTYPGMLDNFTGGGLTAGLGVLECVRKELKEEAGLPDDLVKHLKPVDTLTCAYVEEEGISFECEFVYDLKLPNDFKPQNTDGEVEEFYLMNLKQVKEAIISEEFKPNSAAITLGFLIRKSLIDPDQSEKE